MLLVDRDTEIGLMKEQLRTAAASAPVAVLPRAPSIDAPHDAHVPRGAALSVAPHARAGTLAAHAGAHAGPGMLHQSVEGRHAPAELGAVTCSVDLAHEPVARTGVVPGEALSESLIGTAELLQRQVAHAFVACSVLCAVCRFRCIRVRCTMLGASEQDARALNHSAVAKGVHALIQRVHVSTNSPNANARSMRSSAGGLVVWKLERGLLGAARGRCSRELGEPA